MCSEPNTPPTSSAPAQAQPSGRIPLILGLIIIIGLLSFWLLTRNRVPELTRVIWTQQRELWLKNNPINYDLALKVQVATRPEMRYELQVREGKLSSFKIDGNPNPGGATYTIDGLFDNLEGELDLKEGKAPQNPGMPTNQMLKAEFDEKYGFPKRFMRIAPDNKSFFIEVTQFTPQNTNN